MTASLIIVETDLDRMASDMICFSHVICFWSFGSILQTIEIKLKKRVNRSIRTKILLYVFSKYLNIVIFLFSHFCHIRRSFIPVTTKVQYPVRYYTQ